MDPIVSVLSLTVDGAGGLWIWLGTRTILYRNGHFEDIQSRLPPGEGVITAIGRGRDGSTLLATLNNGIFRFSENRFFSLAPVGISVVTSLAETSDGIVWIGTSESGLYYIDQTHAYRRTALTDAKINCLLPAQNGQLWIGTDDGLVYWNGSNISAADTPPPFKHTQILSLLRDQNSNLWVGSGNGFYRFNDGGVAKLRVGAEEDGPVIGLLEDTERNLWFVNAHSVECLRDGLFMTYSTAQGFPSDHNGAIYVDPENRLWFAPLSGGLYWFLNGEAHRVTNDGVASDVVYSINGSDLGVWVGRQAGGLTHLILRDGAVESRTYTRQSGLPEDSVYFVHQARDGSPWASTLTRGVSHLVNGRFVTLTTSDGLASNSVSNIAESIDGTMWFATADGLSSLTDHVWHNYHVKDGLPSDNIICLAQGSGGALWIGTAEGLAYFSAGKISSFTGMNSLLRDPIFGIALGQSGELWITTASHVLKVNASALVAGNLGTTDLWSFDVEDGLQSVEGVRRPQSVAAGPSGQIWLSMRRGISVLAKESNVGASAPAIPHIEDLQVDGSGLNPLDQMRISSNHHRLSFIFIGLSFAAPNRVRYRYRLEDFDRDWSAPTATREATYTNLRPGHYAFRIEASNSLGQWTGRQASLSFVVVPMFWQTWQFDALCLLGTAGLVFCGYRLHMRQVMERANLRFEERLAERTRIAQELHDTLLQGFLSASMQLNIVSEDIPEESSVKPPLLRISQLMNEVIDEGRRALRGMRSNRPLGPNLEQLFTGILEDMGEPKGIKYRIVVEGPPLDLRPAVRDEISRIGREALVNVFRHARASNIEVEIEYNLRQFRLTIRDNGCGMDGRVVESGREEHWGLSGMRHRAESISAKLSIWSNPGAGTEIDLTVPGRGAYEGHREARRRSLKTWLPAFRSSWRPKKGKEHEL
jgi:signal transduction histidine kinase/ligand-binding sensor domain-containing protein